MSAPMEEEEKMDCEPSGSEWLVEKAQKCIKSDPFTAKAFLITARTLFPQDFSIQFEAYCVEKAARNVKASAGLLLEMFQQFREEPALWRELQLITHALQVENQDSLSEFLKELFETLPAEAQFNILLRGADHAEDILEKCKLKLLMIKKYPDAIIEHGVILVETLLDAEKSGEKIGPVNYFRKLLVCDVLPIICATENMQLSPKQYSKWLQRAMEFYMVYLSQPNKRQETSKAVSPTTPTDIKTQTQGFGMQDRDVVLANPWKSLHQLLIMISERCEWDTKCVPSHERGLRDQWQFISGYHDKNEDFHSSSIRKPTFYATTMLFLRAVFKYACCVDPNQFAGSSSASTSQQPAMVLLDDLESRKKSKRHKHKKRKYEAGELRDPGDSDGSDDSQFPPATILHNKSLGITPELVDSFQTAVDCWQFLSGNELFEKDLTWLLHRWKAEKWQWLTAFQIDKFIYRGEFSQCLRLLQDEHKNLAHTEQPGENPVVLKTLVQMAAAYFRLGQYSSACEMTLNAIWLLPESPSEGTIKRPPSPERQPHSSKHLRQLQLVPCSTNMVMPFFVQLLLLSYKKKAFHHNDTDDNALGHMLVLMQYDWPKEENLFYDVIKRIKKQGEFAYGLYMNYVVCADILEEFAFLKTEEGGKIKLEVLPGSGTSTRQRTITRGITKGGKEDFKFAMERQMIRSGENIDQLIRKFLTTERDSLLQLLM